MAVDAVLSLLAHRVGSWRKRRCAFPINTNVAVFASGVRVQIVTPLKWGRVRMSGVCGLVSCGLIVYMLGRFHGGRARVRRSRENALAASTNPRRRGRGATSRADPFQNHGQLHGENKRRICVA